MSLPVPVAHFPFTFGVEIEFIFAILKSAIYDSDDRLKYPRRLFGSWLGPVLVSLLQDQGLQVVNHGIDETVDYQQWFIDYENGCRIKTTEFLATFFHTHARPGASTSDSWHHDGMELISRVLQLPDLAGRGASYESSLAEVRKYVEALSVDRHAAWFTSITQKCGLHIHIGVPPGDVQLLQIPLNVLQHLAYILIQYEDVISCLHHPHRRGFYKTNEHVGSNKLGINSHEHVCAKFDAQQDAVRDKIFDNEMTQETLAQLMGTNLNPEESFGGGESKRYKFVNWEYIRRYNSRRGSDRAPTIEFRQHRGTLDFNDVKQWVLFLTALMRVAERRAKEATPPNSPSFPSIPRSQLTFSQREGRKYRFRCPRFQNRTEELFDLLGLDRLQQQYWIGKLREYNSNEFIKKPYTQLCMPCKARDQLTDPEAYLNFCRSLDIVDARIDEERRQAGKEDAEWTGGDMQDRENRISAAGGKLQESEHLEDSDLHDPGVVEGARTGGSRKGPYDRVVDPQARTRAGKRESLLRH